MRTSQVIPPIGARPSMNHPLSQGLVGSWLLNEGGGLVSIDGVNRNNGVVGLTAINANRFKVPLFAGTISSIITVPHSGSYNFGNIFTLSCWVRFTSLTGWQNFIMKDLSNTYYVGMSYGGGGLRFQMNGGDVFYSGAISIQRWYHVVGTFDVNNASSQHKKMYLDGRLVGTLNSTASAILCTAAMTFGSDTVNSRHFSGYLKDVKIWNRALTATEVNQLYEKPYSMYQRPKYWFDIISGGGSTAWTKSLTDANTLSDSIQLNFGSKRSDSITLSDADSKLLSLNKSDTISLTDSLLKSFGAKQSDTITLSDSVVKNIGVSASDAVTGIDSLLRAIGLRKSDSLLLSDATAKQIRINKSDIVTVIDSMSKGLYYSASDTLTISDAISKHIELHEMDAVTLEDLIHLLFYFGVLKRWNGSAWVKQKMQHWNGSAYNFKPMRFYDGSQWRQIDVTG